VIRSHQSFAVGMAIAIVLCSSWTTQAQDGGVPPLPQVRILTATASVRGRVVDNTGAPIRSAEVRLRSEDGHDNRVTTSDAGGQFEIRDLTPGKWSLVASKPGFFTPPAARATGTTNDSTSVTLDNGQRLSVNVTLSRAGAIAGRVVDDVGEPLADAQVQAFKRRLTDSGTQFTAAGVADKSDDTGAFRLYAIPPGTYYVRVVTDARDRAPGFVSDGRGIYYPGSSDPQLAEAVTVTAGQDQAGIIVVIPQTTTGVRVTGMVLSANGQPAPEQTSVELIRRSGLGRSNTGLIARVTNGRFAIEGVPAGDYILSAIGGLPNVLQPSTRVSMPIGVPRDDVVLSTGLPVDATSWERAATPISVGASPPGDIAVTMTPTRTLKGVVVAEEGTQLKSILVTVAVQEFDSPIGGQTVVTRAPGEFSIPGIWGAQAVTVSGLPRGWMVKSTEVGGHDLGSGPFDFSTVPATDALRIVITDRVGEVSGTILPGQQGHEGIVVVFPEDETKWRRPSRYVLSAASNDEGSFRVTGLNAMRYLAVALPWLEQDDLLDPAFLAQMKKAATAFTLGDGEKKSLNLPLIQR
jgi:hypothetical protein